MLATQPGELDITSKPHGFLLHPFRGWGLLLCILMLHTIIAAVHISQQDVTTDEPGYYVYGIRWLHGQVERVDKPDDSKSPFTAISALPRTIIQLFNPAYKTNDNGRADLFMGRYLLVIYTWIIAIYFFTWCRQLFGERSWILPLLFFLFDPLVLSYSMMVISDMATGACVIATLYHLYQFYLYRRRRHYLLMSLWVGLSCVAKPSLIFLLPCFVLLWVFLLVARKVQFGLKPTLLFGLFTLFMVLVVINCLYFFRHTFVPLGEQHIRSIAFNSLVNNFPFLKNFPIPVPKTYFDSIDLLQYHKEIGGGTQLSSYPGVYLNGETRLKGGFWYYYIVVAAYKLPIATLLLFIFSMISGLINFNRENFFKKHIWYVWPIVFFLFMLSFVNSFQIGLRHILMIFPLMFLGVAGCLSYWSTRGRFVLPFAMAAYVFMLVSVANYFPELIPYTNEMVRDKKTVYKLMNDSNVDYSQSLMYIPEYIKTHPGVQLPTAAPKAGRYIVAIQQTLSYGPLFPNGYTWFQKFEPVDHFKYSLLIYDISEDDLAKAGLK